MGGRHDRARPDARRLRQRRGAGSLPAVRGPAGSGGGGGELDPETATAADALELVENVIVQLDQFQAAADGLYDQAVSNLNFALTELRQVTFDLGDEGLEVARPLMQESLDTSVTAYNALQERLDVVCGTD